MRVLEARIRAAHGPPARPGNLRLATRNIRDLRQFEHVFMKSLVENTIAVAIRDSPLNCGGRVRPKAEGGRRVVASSRVW